MSNALSRTPLQEALKQIQLRAQLVTGRSMTYCDLAEVAGVTPRSMGDWMRGASAPIAMSAVFELLSCLPEDDVKAVLHRWKEMGDQGPRVRREGASRKWPADQDKLTDN